MSRTMAGVLLIPRPAAAFAIIPGAAVDPQVRIQGAGTGNL